MAKDEKFCYKEAVRKNRLHARKLKDETINNKENERKKNYYAKRLAKDEKFRYHESIRKNRFYERFTNDPEKARESIRKSCQIASKESISLQLKDCDTN